MTCTNDHFGPACELADQHEGPHRNGLLIWHDPPLLVLGTSSGNSTTVEASTEPGTQNPY